MDDIRLIKSGSPERYQGIQASYSYHSSTVFANNPITEPLCVDQNGMFCYDVRRKSNRHMRTKEMQASESQAFTEK